jgi:type IV secretion system protein VirD4
MSEEGLGDVGNRSLGVYQAPDNCYPQLWSLNRIRPGAARQNKETRWLMFKLCRLLLVVAMLAAIYCIALFALRIGPWSLVILVGLVAYGAKLGRDRFTAFGTARWADTDDLRKAGMLEAKEGVFIGRMQESRGSYAAALASLLSPRADSKAACQRFLTHCGRRTKAKGIQVRLPNVVHLAVFAPTGVGKGVSCVIPHLLTCPDSNVVVDFKGELARTTAEHRRKVFGHRIVLLDPFKVVTQSPDTFNSLDYVDRDSPVALDECRELAESQVIRTGQEKEPHWPDCAEIWIAAMTAAVVYYGEANNRSMQTVRGLLTDPAQMESVIKLLCESELCDGMLARLGHQLTHFKDKELASTLTTSNRFLRYLDTLAVASSTARSSFDPADLRQGRMTVYLVLPPDHMRSQSSLLRMWISALLRAVIRGGLQEKNRVHFVLDEAASLGHMDAIDDAIDKYRGYGVRLQLYYQSLGQLKKCFPDGQEQTLLSNVTQMYFGVNETFTADQVSTRLGEGTVVIASGGNNTSSSEQVSNQNGQTTRSTSWSTNNNWQQHGRRLLKPEEVMALPERMAITFTPGVPPLLTTLVRYYEDSIGPPGLWERFKFGVWSLMFSLLFATFFVMVALALSLSMFAASE